MYSLKPDSDQSFHSKSKATTLFLEKCVHSKKVHSKSRENCFYCGIHISKNQELISYKSTMYSFKALMDVETFCTAIFKKKQLLKETVLKTTHPYYKNRVSLIDLIYKVTERLHLSQNTTQMAVTYLDFVVLKGYIPSGQYQIYSITAIFLAAKAIELDKRIPFISSLRKCAIEDFKPEDIKRTEEIMLEILDWNTQFATLIDIIDYYLSQGIIFSNDSIGLISSENLNTLELKKNISEKTSRFANRIEKSKSVAEPKGNATSSVLRVIEKGPLEAVKLVKDMNEKEILELVGQLEKDARYYSNIIIKDAMFLESNLRLLSAGLIAFLRKKHGFKNYWNEELCIISNGINEADFNDEMNRIITKLDENLMFSIENEPNKLRKHRNTLFERKDIYQKINKNNTENEKSFAPLNSSNLEKQTKNTVFLKNPIVKPKKILK